MVTELSRDGSFYRKVQRAHAGTNLCNTSRIVLVRVTIHISSLTQPANSKRNYVEEHNFRPAGIEVKEQET